MTVGRLAPAPVIQLPEFEGPLDLLLTLVERRRLPIAELSLALVADQYLAQVRAMAGSDPEPLSEFLAIAARLLLLKSRALLPQIEPPRDAEGEEASSEDLVRRLEVYRAFKTLAQELGVRLEGGSAYTRGAAGEILGLDAPAPLRAIGPSDLFDLIRAIEARDATPNMQTAEPLFRTTVAQRLAYLRERLLAAEALDWRDVGGETVDELVATLLAVLELVRRGEARVLQPSLFGPIRLYRAD
ncbi:MAG: segregation/condensation protein A [Chloroflexota bacterium]|nr:segregation/condensation protein A [Chloroflexota bacterium]